MSYFTVVNAYVKEKPLKTIYAITLDMFFYIALFTTFVLCINSITLQIQKLPMAAMGQMLATLEGMEGLVKILLNAVLGIILTFLLLLLLGIVHITVFKGLHWIIISGKKEYKIIWKGMVLTFVMGCILLIPFILSLFPFFILALQHEVNVPGMMPDVTYPSFVHFIPFIIFLIIASYLFNVAYCFFMMEKKIRTALKYTFTKGFRKIGLILPYVFLFLGTSALFKIAINYSLLNIYTIIIIVLAFAKVSFFNRVYINSRL